uniref:Dynactin subunit 3 n=1 Tax=Taeniopygia guttata TaxID=59729 RepID=A0A674HEN6_TAEGU
MKRPSTAFRGSGRAARLPLQCKSPSTAPHPLRGAPRRQTRPPLPSPWQPRSLATRRHSNRRGAPEVRRGRFRPAQRWRRALRSCGGCSGGWKSWNNASASAAAGRKRCWGGAAESGRLVRSGGAWGAAARRGLTAPSPPSVPLQVADELVKVQVALNNIAGKRERIKILFKKIEDIIKYLDPQYIDRMAVPDTMKLQFILAEEQAIPARAALLEQVKNLQPILDSTSIQAVPDHAAKLQRLSQIHIQQQEKRHDLTDSVKTLLEDYNKMTLLLSKQFVQWNEILTRLEVAKQAKPVAE